MDHLHDSRPNHVIELAGTKYLPRPEPAAGGSKKNKAGAVSKAEAIPRKSGGAKTQGGGGACPRQGTGHPKGSCCWQGSSGLSTGEKASATTVSSGPPSASKGDTKRALQASTQKDESGYVLAHVVNLVY
jgi:hypothetical protein